MAETFSDEDGDVYVKPSDEPEGAIGPEDLVQPETTYEVPDARPQVESPPTYDLESIAVEVSQGKWGVGQDRRRRLSEAGYNAREVEAEVRRLLNP